MSINWRSEKTGNVVNGVLAQTPVRVVIDGSLPSEAEIEVYEVLEPVVRRLVALRGKRPGRKELTLGVDPKGPSLARAGVSTVVWEPAHLPPPESPTKYRAWYEGEATGPLNVGPPVQFEWSHHGEAMGNATVPVPHAPVVAGGRATLGNSQVLRGTAYGATDPDIELRLLNLGPRAQTDPNEDVLRSYLESYLGAVGERYGVDGLAGVFYESYYRYTESEGFRAVLEPARTSIKEGQTIALEFEVSFDVPANLLLALAAFDQEGGELVAMSELIGLTFDGEWTAIDF